MGVYYSVVMSSIKPTYDFLAVPVTEPLLLLLQLAALSVIPLTGDGLHETHE